MMTRRHDGAAFAWMVCASSLMAFAMGGCSGGTDTQGSGGTTTDTGSGGSTTSTQTGGQNTGGTTSNTGGSTAGTGGDLGPCAGVIEGFVPEWHPSTGLHQKKCTDLEVEEYVDVCVGPVPDMAKCQDFQNASATCFGCVLSFPNDPDYGPMTIYTKPEVLYENPGQCVASIEMDNTDAGCGAQVFATIQCTVEACADCTYGEGEFQTLLDCLSAAEAGGCKDFAAKSAECKADLVAQGVPIEPCFVGNQDFFVYLKSLSKLFCGP